MPTLTIPRRPATSFNNVEQEVDFHSSEGLRALILKLNATENGWRTSPVANDLMAYCRQKYTPVAKAWHRDPDDAAFEAFIAMRSPSTARAKDPWAIVTKAVALGIAAETHADRLLTSQDKARRPSKRPDAEPVRTGHYEEFFYDVHPHTPTHESDQSISGLVRTSCVFLVVTGWPARPVEAAVDHISGRITDYSSRESALDIVSHDLAMAVRLGYSPNTWRALVRLLIGGRSKVAQDAQLGLFARVLLGDTVAELLTDTHLVERSRAAQPEASDA